MIGLDTNVLVRYLVQDDAEQARKAAAAIEGASSRGEEIYLAGVNLCELVWVLETAYQRERRDIASTLEQIVRTAGVTVENANEVREAIDLYRSTSADFADALVGRLNQLAGCDHTLTFDKGLKRLTQFRVIQ
jgi:predicted nucleic-acid-binding protein